MPRATNGARFRHCLVYWSDKNLVCRQALSQSFVLKLHGQHQAATLGIGVTKWQINQNSFKRLLVF